MVTTALLVLALAQAEADEEVRWRVGGVLSTDINGIVSDRGSRDTMAEEGVVGEYEVNGDLHLGREIRVSMAACVGCHGFEVRSAFAEVGLLEGVRVRAGRLPVPFGGFSRRTGPGQMDSTSKPLPYIMGLMVRGEEFNMGIVPGPTVDNGAVVQADVWLGDDAKLSLEAAVIRGLKGGGSALDFARSREFQDDNGEPAAAGRLTLALGPLTLGGSAMGGHHDSEGELAYRMASVEAQVRAGPVALRLEGVARDTEFRDAALSETTSRRLAYAAQVEVELHPQWRAYILNDALKVSDVFLTPAGPVTIPAAGATDDENTILRWSGGAVYAFRPGMRLKGSAEYWRFSDFDDTWVFHLTFVIVF